MASHADGIAGFSLKSNALATPTMAREMRRATRLEPMITLRRPGGHWIRFNILSTSKGISPFLVYRDIQYLNLLPTAQVYS